MTLALDGSEVSPRVSHLIFSRIADRQRVGSVVVLVAVGSQLRAKLASKD